MAKTVEAGRCIDVGTANGMAEVEDSKEVTGGVQAGPDGFTAKG